MVSLNNALRLIGIPALDLFEVMTGKPAHLVAYEDNESTQKMVRSGKYVAMRHVKRTHGVSLTLLTDSDS